MKKYKQEHDFENGNTLSTFLLGLTVSLIIYSFFYKRDELYDEEEDDFYSPHSGLNKDPYANLTKDQLNELENNALDKKDYPLAFKIASLIDQKK